MDTSQKRLFKTAPVAVSITASYCYGAGWHLNMVSRRDGEPWAEARCEVYDRLTTEELEDILEVVVPSLIRP